MLLINLPCLYSNVCINWYTIAMLVKMKIFNKANKSKVIHSCIPPGIYVFTHLIPLQGSFPHEDVFENIIPACKTIQDIVIKVFENNAEMIMSQFVQTVFEKKVQVICNID